MKKITYFIYLKISLLFLLTLVLFSCNRDDIIDKSFTDTNPIDIEYFNRSSISGHILDENYIPLANVEVKYINEQSIQETFISDENGYFIIENKPFKEQGQLFTFDKENHFTQYAIVKPKLNKLSFLNIFQQKKEGEKIIDPKIQNELFYYQNQINCTIPINSFIDNNGDHYNNDVSFYIKAPHLEEDFVFFDPGFGIPSSDFAQTIDGDETSVVPVFSFLVEFENQNGNQLNIDNPLNIEAQIDFGLFSDFENLFLWHFDNTTGHWTEKSEIDLSSSFSKLNFDIEKSGYYILSDKHLAAIEISGFVYFADGSPAKNIQIQLVEKDSLGSLFCGTISTDDNGKYYFSHHFPENLTFIIYGCDPINSTEITPEIIDNTIEDIILEPNFKDKYNITINSSNITFDKGFIEVYDYLSFIPSSEIIPVNNDSSDINLEFYGCAPNLIFYNLDNIPNVKSSYPISISNNQTINPGDYNIDYDIDQYLFADINNSQESVFDINIFYFLDEYDDQIYNIGTSMNNSFIALRFKKGENLCHFSYLKFHNEFDYDIYESTFDKPLQLEIISDDSHMVSGHFYGDINYNGENKYINGYFKAIKF